MEFALSDFAFNLFYIDSVLFNSICFLAKLKTLEICYAKIDMDLKISVENRPSIVDKRPFNQQRQKNKL